MATFTDIFIERPVLASVISLLILVVGLRAIFDLQVREYPKMENTLITVTISYPGASADLVRGFITTPMEKEIASADGIDYMTSQSIDGLSTISCYIRLNFNPDDAFTSILSKVQAAEQYMPREAEKPVLDKQTGSSIALMYMSFSSDAMTPQQITDYLTRVVQPKLETISGVAQAEILGDQTFAMRVWLDTNRLSGMGITYNEVYDELIANNFLSAAGTTKGKYAQISIRPLTDLSTPEGFGNIVLKKSDNGALLKMKDVGKVELGSETYDTSVYFNGKKAVFIGVTATPTANPLAVISELKKTLPGIEANFPPVLKGKIVYDATKYIRSSIKEVLKTIFEAAIIVIIIIFLFLGSFRSVTVPIVTIPLSLVGVFGIMLFLGYSINLLTLLSLVLAIGMVVDDAIVVVENVYRHVEEGMSPKEAAIKGAGEIAMPIVAMTLTLAAVYAPIGLMGGITGALFKEFAFTLASAVILSGIIALTLSPMMCSKVLSSELGKSRLVHFIDKTFEGLKNKYASALNGTLNSRALVVGFAFVVLVSCFFLFINSKRELAPEEDKGAVFVMAQGSQSASLKYTELFTNEFDRIYKGVPALEDYFIVNGNTTPNTVFSAIILKPWDERNLSSKQVNKMIQEEFNALPGLQIQAFPLSPLPTGGSPIPIQFVVNSTRPFNVVYPVAEELVDAARKSGLFLFVNNSLKYDKPQMNIDIDRDKTAELGIGNQALATSLSTAFGGNYVNRFSVQGYSYKVIPQVFDHFRSNPFWVEQVYLKTSSGGVVPLSSVTRVHYIIRPNILTRFQQLNSATIQGLMTPGHTINEGLEFLRAEAKKIFPQGVSYDYAGQSRQLIQEGSALIITFFFSIVFIYLVLSAQFESFRDPLVIMTSVPMAICGALLPINWGLSTVNIYTQVGLITLIGLITKHGILMVDFANHIHKNENVSMQEAISRAAAIRLRPVLMTTFSMILGVVPLLLATGAGAVSRFDIGLTISSGMLIGTLFTLFVVPTMYMLKPRQILLLLIAVGATVALIYYTFF